MDLKIGGSNVGKIMYGGQEFGGATKLEPGTILYISEKADRSNSELKNVHLLSTTKNWNNINGINIWFFIDDISSRNVTIDFSSDNFKNLDIEKIYNINIYKMNISRSIVDKEYRLNVSGIPYNYRMAVKAI